MYKHCILLAIGAMLFATAGCGSSLPPVNVVSGTVMYDGEPLVGATVAFHPQEKNEAGMASRAASGISNDAGKFTLKMQYADGGTPVTLKGAPTGNYNVTVTLLESTTDFEGENVDPSAGADGGNDLNAEYMAAMGDPRNQMEIKSLINVKFRLAYETPLTAEVGEGENTFTIDLKSNGQGTVSGSVQ